MANGTKFWGSINLDQINEAVKDGVKPFQGEKGKYLGIEVWVNDEPDQFGNSLSIKIYNKDTQNSFYLGNLKKSDYQAGGGQQAPQQQAQTPPAAPEPDLPF